MKIEYFGFNSGTSPTEDGSESLSSSGYAAPWVMAESALRQAGRITENALILGDQLEDIAEPNSQAAIQLRQRGPFDVVNIDPCNHLAYVPKGRQKNTFDALQALLQHQTGSKSPWLLFITTRVSVELMGPPAFAFQNAITQNLTLPGSGFSSALAECLQANSARLASELATVWTEHDERFLKLYSVGLGKFLLQFFHGQPNLPANVELESVFAYRVYSEKPDMLALAFKVSPDPMRVFAGQIGGSLAYPLLEPDRAIKVAKRAMQLSDIDTLLTHNEYIRNEAVNGTKSLLTAAKFDIKKWAEWLATHKRRPMSIA